MLRCRRITPVPPDCSTTDLPPYPDVGSTQDCLPPPRRYAAVSAVCDYHAQFPPPVPFPDCHTCVLVSVLFACNTCSRFGWGQFPRPLTRSGWFTIFCRCLYLTVCIPVPCRTFCSNAVFLPAVAAPVRFPTVFFATFRAGLFRFHAHLPLPYWTFAELPHARVLVPRRTLVFPAPGLHARIC